MARALAKKAETSTTLLEAAKKVLRQNGHSGLSTRDVAAAAGVPLSQIHYHFGSRQGLMLALFDYLNAQLLDRQNAMFHDTKLSLSQRWDRACDYLDEDIDSGYVRVLQELIAASWSDPAVAKVVRTGHMGWFELITGVARQAERELGGLGPFSVAEIGALISSAFIGGESLYLWAWKEGLAMPGTAARGRHIRIASKSSRGDTMRASCRTGTGRRTQRREIHYEVYGQGSPAMAFLPPWSIVHSRVYKAQIPYFSERFRCITFDARGNGRTDRPADVAAYALDQHVADALAVMDATQAGAAIMVGLSYGGMIACCLAAHHPERVKAAILAGTAGSIGPNRPHMAHEHFYAKRERFEGWDKYNRDYWLRDYPDFAEHFIRNIFTEPHSTKQIEDGIEWASNTCGAVLVKTVEARAMVPADVSKKMYAKIRCPVLLIHGDDDQIQPHARGEAVAEAIGAGAEMVTLAGVGHNPLGRFPAKCNALINDFLDRRLGLAAPGKRTARLTREKKALYLSSPIGLGHGRRDIAIVRELRQLHPALAIDWLAQDPVTRLLEANGERVHPLSARLASETQHIEEESGEHDLNAFQAIRRMDEVLIKNFMIFRMPSFGRLRPGDRRRGLGHRPLLARASGAEEGEPCLVHRLRRLRADAVGRAR
jgi:pimeloyl-ACP methyl ester carboxylesterase/AcrR family transcriptional regulator